MSGTTAKGIVYPTNTDNIDFAADMQALAESVNNNFLALSGGTLTGAITANSGMSKGYRLNNEGGSANSRLWSNYVSGSTWRVAAVDDAAGAGTDFLTLDRVGSLITLSQPVKLTNYAFRAEATTGNIAASAGWTDFTMFNSKVYDPANAFNTTTGVFTVPVAGLWQFTHFHSHNASAQMTYSMKSNLMINSVSKFEIISYSNDSASALARKSTELTWTGLCSAGDPVKIQYANGHTAAVALETSTSRRAFFSGHLLSAS
jgi:hypothetical protein